MKYPLCLLVLTMSAASPVLAAPGTAVPVQSDRVHLQLDAIPVSELVTLLYRDILKTPYVVAPEVSTDHRTVSIRLDTTTGEAHRQVMAYLKAIGLTVTRVEGIDQITTRGPVSMVPGSFDAGDLPPSLASLDRPPMPGGGFGLYGPVAAPVEPPSPPEVGFYRPRFRDPVFLSDVIRSIFPELRFGTRSQAEQAGPRLDGINAPDALVFAGTEADVEAAMELAARLDTEVPRISIKATVFEVQTGQSNQSAISLALNLLSGKLLGGAATSSSPLNSYARLRTANVDAVVSALASDNRFRVVTSPFVLTRSGGEARLSSGSQVPVLSSITYTGDSGSVPIQSVEYRDSGVILKVRPVAREDVIDVDLSQEVSNFVRTETGVNSSPTLNKRSITNQLSVRSGDVLVIGGLTEDRDSRTKSGLFSGLWLGKSREVSSSEVVLVLQVAIFGSDAVSWSS